MPHQYIFDHYHLYHFLVSYGHVALSYTNNYMCKVPPRFRTELHSREDTREFTGGVHEEKQETRECGRMEGSWRAGLGARTGGGTGERIGEEMNGDHHRKPNNPNPIQEVPIFLRLEE